MQKDSHMKFVSLSTPWYGCEQPVPVSRILRHGNVVNVPKSDSYNKQGLQRSFISPNSPRGEVQ